MVLIDEVREDAMKRMAKHKEAMARYYNKKVKVRRFNIRDLALRKCHRQQMTHPKENLDQPGKAPTR